MRIIKKIYEKIIKKIIFCWDGVNNQKFTKKYVKFLKKQGVNFTGTPNYICSSVKFDGTGYKLITIGEECVISMNVLLLTHDFSIRTGARALNYEEKEIENYHIEASITIGDNSFIGARAVLLPGTSIGKNCIVGAGSVLKGNYPDNSVIFGNPACVKCDVYTWAKRKIDNTIIKKSIF